MTKILLTSPVNGVRGYLKEYDLNAWQGRGRVSMTDKEEAMVFTDVAAAFEAWRAQSTAYPTRPDGQPNRPLTAFHAEFVP